MACGGGRSDALEELDQVQHSLSQSLRSFGSVPVGFVLDNIPDFISNAVRFGLSRRFLILVFSLRGGKFQQTQEFSRCV